MGKIPNPGTCYGLRRLNPFRGVMQVAENGDARALSIDGINWQIQILMETPTRHWGSLTRETTRRRYYRFGYWSQQHGLSRVPVNPDLDLSSMLAAWEELSKRLPNYLLDLPFPLADSHERWLLDECGTPLALLASVKTPELMDDSEPANWKAAAPTSKYAQRAGEGNQAVAPWTLLEQRIKDHSQAAKWFVRGADGSGMSMAASSTLETKALHLGPNSFPVLTIRTEWDSHEMTSLVDGWIRQMSPWLLTLSKVPDTTRRLLEMQACKQALAVENQFRLYPLVLDRNMIDLCRVEAKIRQSTSQE